MRERLRDKERLVHILTITPHKVWRVIDNDLPTLRPLIERYIAEESAE